MITVKGPITDAQMMKIADLIGRGSVEVPSVMDSIGHENWARLGRAMHEDQHRYEDNFHIVRPL